MKKNYENTFGWKSVIWLLILLGFGILLLNALSQIESDSPQALINLSPQAASWLTWGSIFLFSCLLLWFLIHKSVWMIQRFVHDRLIKVPLISFAVLLFLGLILNQVFLQNVILNNLFLFFFVLLALDFAVRLTRSAFILLFVIIMLSDIYLVWMAAGSMTVNGHISWYIAMLDSNFMKHFPFPIAFRWDNHFLGNGDIFFMGLTVMYAKRIWHLKAAIISGVIFTATLILLTIVEKWLPNAPAVWPYTIFISPVALFIAIFAPKILRIPDEWKDLDGPEVIGRFPKTRK